MGISARLSRNDKLGQNDDNCERDMGILLISLLAKGKTGLELRELGLELGELDLKFTEEMGE